MAEAPPVSGTVLARVGVGPSLIAEVWSVTSSRAAAIHIARVARTRVRDSGSEGPSHARRAYGDLDYRRLGREARQLGFQGEPVCPSAQRVDVGVPYSRGSGCTDLRRAGVGDWQGIAA